MQKGNKYTHKNKKIVKESKYTHVNNKKDNRKNVPISASDHNVLPE